MKISSKKQKNRPHFRKRVLVLLTIVIICGAILGLTYFINRTNNKTAAPSPADSSQGAAGTSTYSKSTKSNDNTNATPASSQDVLITIVDANQYDNNFEVRAYANISESGICKLSFTQGTYSFTKNSDANGGPNTSSCRTIDIPTSEFPNTGDWQLSITYTSSSNKYSGHITKIITVK